MCEDNLAMLKQCEDELASWQDYERPPTPDSKAAYEAEIAEIKAKNTALTHQLQALKDRLQTEPGHRS